MQPKTERKTWGVHLNLKQQKNEDTLTQIMLVMTVNKQRIRVYTKLRVQPRYWDARYNRCNLQGRISLRERQRLRSINEQIERIINAVCEADQRMASIGEYLNRNELRRVVMECQTAERKAENPMEVLRNIASDYTKNINRKGKRGIESTCTAYLTALERLEDFIRQRQIPVRSFDDFNKRFFQEFTDFLYGYIYGKGVRARHYTQNTVINTLKVIKNLLHRAYDNEWTANNYYQKVQTALPSDVSEQVYLSESEIRTLSQIATCNQRELHVRDMFCIACYTGLRISDIKRLSEAKIQHGVITLYQKKTQELVEIPIFKEVAPLIEHYRQVGFPKIHSTSANRIIKTLAARCRIDEPITRKECRGGQTILHKQPKYALVSFHTARRSCITNLYKRGYPANYIMTLSGHRSIQAFQRYMKASNSELLKNFMHLLEQEKAI